MFKYVVLLLLVMGCSKGPHVVEDHITVTVWDCRYSDSIWRADRTIAQCTTAEECNKICAQLPR